jgi:thiol:disulfide interchange protein DsbA
MLFSLTACAQDATETYLEGRDYYLLDQPVRTANPNKIEVVEVFSYHCPHCFEFEPQLKKWQQAQASDVMLVPTHAKWNDAMDALARGFYTAQVLKIDEKTHEEIFKAFQIDHKPLTNAEDWANFFAGFGIAKPKAIETYNSFVVDSLVNQAVARMRSYKISATPEMVVEGKYRINSRIEGGHASMLKVVDYLVEKSRAERASRKP